MAFQGLVPSIRRFVFGDTAALITRTIQTYLQSVGVAEVYIDIDAIKAITEGFNKNAAVYSIVMKFAQKFGNIPRYVYDAAAKQEKGKKIRKGNEFKAYSKPANNIYDENHPLVKLLNRPNEYESQDCFFTKVCAYYKVCGESMIWLNRGVDVVEYLLPDGTYDDKAISLLPVVEMYVLPADKLNPIPDPENPYGIKAWRLDLGGQKIDIPKSCVIHWKSTSMLSEFPLRNNLRGYSPLSAGYQTLQQNRSMSDAAVRMAQNDGARGVLVNKTIGASQSPTQQTQVRRTFDNGINNNKLKGAIAALEGDWTYENFGQTATDMQLLEGKEMSWKELCFLLSVPYEFFNADTTFANKEIAQKGWVTNDIMPACKQLDGEMNRALLPAFGLETAAFIGADASELPEMQIDMAAMTTALAGAWWFTPNEKREMMEEEPYEDPKFDEPWVPSGVTPLSDNADQNMLDIQAQIQTIKNGGDNKPTGKTGNKP